MPSTPRLQSDLLALVRSLPTVKDSVQAKQGLRNLRDELLYRKSDKPVLLTDTAKMEELEISDLLQANMSTKEIQKVKVKRQNTNSKAKGFCGIFKSNFHFWL